MAKSTAEDLAQKLPLTRKTIRQNILLLLWMRNKGYVNRKTNSFLFDLLEVLSLALLADVNSLKYLYLIWVIFYLAQGILESLFYSARKSFVFEKEMPSQRALLYIHALVISVPLLFLFVSIERFSANNIAMTYLFYKSVILLFTVIYNFLNFKTQTLARVYYPPMLNWFLLAGSIILISLSHQILWNIVTFYLTLTVVALTKLIQEIEVNKRSKILAHSINWKLKEQKIKTSNSLKEFFVLIGIEILLPFGVLFNFKNNISVKTMLYISLTYMMTKILMRPMRSLTLDYRSLKKETKKYIHTITYTVAIMTFGSAYFFASASTFLTALGFIYFSLLLFWNASLVNSKIVVLLNMACLTCLLKNGNLSYLALFFMALFYILINLKDKPPRNIIKKIKTIGYESKYVLNFKENTNWEQLARKYPQISWIPLGKRLCVIDANNNTELVESLIYQRSFDLLKIEQLSLELAKKYNIT